MVTTGEEQQADPPERLPDLLKTIDAFAAVLRQGYETPFVGDGTKLPHTDKRSIPLYHAYHNLIRANGTKDGKPVIKIYVPNGPAADKALYDTIKTTELNTVAECPRSFYGDEYTNILPGFKNIQKEMQAYFSVQITNDIEKADIITLTGEAGIDDHNAFYSGSTEFFKGKKHSFIVVNSHRLDKMADETMLDDLLHEFLHALGLKHLHDPNVKFTQEQTNTINSWGAAGRHYALSTMYYPTPYYSANNIRIRKVRDGKLKPFDRMQIEYGMHTATQDEYVNEKRFIKAFMAKEYSYIPLFNGPNPKETLEKLHSFTSSYSYSAEETYNALKFLHDNRDDYQALMNQTTETIDALYELKRAYHIVLGIENYSPQDIMEDAIRSCDKNDREIDSIEYMILENLSDITGMEVQYKNGQVILPMCAQDGGGIGKDACNKVILDNMRFSF